MTGQGGTDRPVFDPRHDPRFQRGYQAGDAAPVARQPRHDPLSLPVGAPTVAPASAAAEPEDSADIPDLDGFDPELFQDELEPSRWNPFIALLWLVVVVFIGGAVVLQVQAATLSNSNSFYDGNGPVPIEMLIQQLSYSVASPMLIAGLVTLAGLLFWHAWAWRARRLPAGS
ncbi:hypothetical protein [Cryobacterium sp. AP23]